MMILVDYNLNGYVVLLQGTLVSNGWLDLLSIEFITLKEVSLAADTDDRTIWRFAQSNQMLLLTANRNAKGKDSLEQTMSEEGLPTSLPVLTIANLDRFIEKNYRERCGARIIEIILDLDNYLGVNRVFIP
jgi:predicted nuclease of predicted toxin-antitoxin system